MLVKPTRRARLSSKVFCSVLMLLVASSSIADDKTQTVDTLAQLLVYDGSCISLTRSKGELMRWTGESPAIGSVETRRPVVQELGIDLSEASTRSMLAASIEFLLTRFRIDYADFLFFCQSYKAPAGVTLSQRANPAYWTAAEMMMDARRHR